MMICLVWMGAAAETCSHGTLLMCSLRSEWVDMDDGHQMVYTKSCVCDDCSQNIVSVTYGEFAGHAFRLSESIHFEADGMHLWVFLCPECWHVTRREQACTGGDQCMMYSVRTGERPPVAQGESIGDYRVLTDEDYVRRWLNQCRTN